MWLFPISEVSCTDTARRGRVGGGFPPAKGRLRPDDRTAWQPPRSRAPPMPRWLMQQERQLAYDTMKTPSSVRSPSVKPLVPSLNLSASSAGNMPLQPSPVIPEPQPDPIMQGSSAPLPKRDKSGAPRKYSVKRPYNWRDIQSNVRY